MSINRNGFIYPQDQPEVSSGHQVLGEYYPDFFKDIPTSVGAMRIPRLFANHDQRISHEKTAAVSGSVWVEHGVSSRASSSNGHLHSPVGKSDWRLYSPIEKSDWRPRDPRSLSFAELAQEGSVIPEAIPSSYTASNFDVDIEPDSAVMSRFHPNSADNPFISKTPTERNVFLSAHMKPVQNGKHRHLLMDANSNSLSMFAKSSSSDVGQRLSFDMKKDKSQGVPRFNKCQPPGNKDGGLSPLNSANKVAPTFTVSPLPGSQFISPVAVSPFSLPPPLTPTLTPTLITPTITGTSTSFSKKLGAIGQGMSSVPASDFVDTEVCLMESSSKRLRDGVVLKVFRDKMMAVVCLYSSRTKFVKVRCSELIRVIPSPPDMVKVVFSRDKSLGKVGKLISVTGDCGVVQFGSKDGVLTQVNMSDLAKYVNKQKFLRPSSERRQPITDTEYSPVNHVNPKMTNSSHQSSSNHTPYMSPLNFPLSTACSGLPHLLNPSSASVSPSAASSNPFIISSPVKHVPIAQNDASPTSIFRPFENGGHVPLKSSKSLASLPLSLQVCPTTSKQHSSSFFLPQPHNGFRLESSRLSDITHQGRGVAVSSDCATPTIKPPSSFTLRPSNGISRSQVAEILERLVSHQRKYLFESSVDPTDESAKDVKTSCVRVSLICPISQKRMKYPTRGFHCKHLQCFDAETYIILNIHHKVKARVKNSNGQSSVQFLSHRKWQCPICHKHLHLNHLYIDRSLMNVLNEYEDSITEAELTSSDSWKPVKKTPEAIEIIDLTNDDG